MLLTLQTTTHQTTHTQSTYYQEEKSYLNVFSVHAYDFMSMIFMVSGLTGSSKLGWAIFGLKIHHILYMRTSLHLYIKVSPTSDEASGRIVEILHMHVQSLIIRQYSKPINRFFIMWTLELKRHLGVGTNRPMLTQTYIMQVSIHLLKHVNIIIAVSHLYMHFFTYWRALVYIWQTTESY